MITQSTFVIPPEIEAGLRSGDLIQFGGIVRNQLGHIVKHLKEVPLPAADENALRQIATVVRNPRVLVPTLAFNMILAYPIYGLCARLLPPRLVIRREVTPAV